MSERMIQHNLELIDRIGLKDIAAREHLKYLKMLQSDEITVKHAGITFKSLIDTEISFLEKLLNI